MAIPTERIEATVVEGRDILTPVGPRVRWGGVMSGLFVAIGTLMLLTALGLAIGITALGDPRAATGETASGLVGIHGPKLPAPIAHGLGGQHEPACGHELFDIAIAETEADIQPDAVVSDVGREYADPHTAAAWHRAAGPGAAARTRICAA